MKKALSFALFAFLAVTVLHATSLLIPVELLKLDTMYTDLRDQFVEQFDSTNNSTSSILYVSRMSSAIETLEQLIEIEDSNTTFQRVDRHHYLDLISLRDQGTALGEVGISNNDFLIVRRESRGQRAVYYMGWDFGSDGNDYVSEFSTLRIVGILGSLVLSLLFYINLPEDPRKKKD